MLLSSRVVSGLVQDVDVVGGALGVTCWKRQSRSLSHFPPSQKILHAFLGVDELLEAGDLGDADDASGLRLRAGELGPPFWFAATPGGPT